jgi:hypothetical protein
LLNAVPRWRIVAGCAILAGLLGILAVFAPYYTRNLELQNFVSGLTRDPQNVSKSDDVLTSWVLDQAHGMGVPLKEENVHIVRSEGGLQIDVRYVVGVNLPGYTVNLHFYPGAGSR